LLAQKALDIEDEVKSQVLLKEKVLFNDTRDEALNSLNCLPFDRAFYVRFLVTAPCFLWFHFIFCGLS